MSVEEQMQGLANALNDHASAIRELVAVLPKAAAPSAEKPAANRKPQPETAEIPKKQVAAEPEDSDAAELEDPLGEDDEKESAAEPEITADTLRDLVIEIAKYDRDAVKQLVVKIIGVPKLKDADPEDYPELHAAMLKLLKKVKSKGGD